MDGGRPRPCRVIADPVELQVVQATDRHRELVADLAPEGARRGKAQMVGINRCAPVNQAGLMAFAASKKCDQRWKLLGDFIAKNGGGRARD